MTVTELARLAAVEILAQMARADLREPRLDMAARLIEGAITRALDEQTRALSEVVHVHGQVGSIDVKVTKSTQGVSLEVDVKRGREPDEDWEEASAASASLAAETYRSALKELRPLGLVPGKEPKP